MRFGPQHLAATAIVGALVAATIYVAVADPERDADALPCTNEATRTAAQEHNVHNAPTPGVSEWLPVDSEIDCRLKRALLTEGDLPPGMTGDEPSVVTDFYTPCLRQDFPFYEGLDRTFFGEADDDDRYLQQSIVVLPERQIPWIFEIGRNNCATLSSTSEFTGERYDEINIGEHGDETFSAVLRTGGSSDNIVVVAVARADVLLTIVSTLSQDETRTIVETAVARLDRAEPLPPSAIRLGGSCPAIPEFESGATAVLLRTALLRAGDLDGRGWLERVPTGCDTFKDDEVCDLLDPRLTAEGVTTVMSTSRSISGILSMAIRLYADESAAERALADAQRRSAQPFQCVAKAKSGEHRWTYEPLPVGDLADGVAARQLNWEGPDVERPLGTRPPKGTWYAAAVRQGAAIASFAYTSSEILGARGEVDPVELARLERYAVRTLDKLTEVEGDLAGSE